MKTSVFIPTFFTHGNAEGISEPAHSLLLLPRQFYGTALPCAGLYPLEKTGIARCMPDIL